MSEKSDNSRRVFEYRVAVNWVIVNLNRVQKKTEASPVC